MSAVYKFEELFPDQTEAAPVAEAAAAPSRLTDRLDAKLGELSAAGYRIQWIEVSQKDLITLFIEGGDQAVMMDPDPDSDRAWYGEFEVRPSPKDFVWIYLEGEFEQMSAHIIS
jgi:hypothetical protein